MQALQSLHLTNERVRSQFLGDFDKARKQHLDRTGGSAASGQKKALTAKERAAMIAKMQVRPCLQSCESNRASKSCDSHTAIHLMEATLCRRLVGLHTSREGVALGGICGLSEAWDMW